MTRALAALILALPAAACYSSAGGDSDAAGDPDALLTPYSVTIVAENADPEICSSCVYYLEFNYYASPPTYGMGITWNGDDIIWQTPFCTMPCEGATDPMGCCMDCAAPMPAVKQLVPGESIAIPWSGNVYTIDPEHCTCGCTWRSTAPAGSGTARICAYRAYACTDGSTCIVEEDGLIKMAEGSGEPVCSSIDFSFPADDGGRLVIFL